MNFLEFLGEIISEELNISIYAAKGLLKLSIKEELGPFFSYNNLNYNLLKKVINNSLVSRMERLGVSNNEKIRNYLLEKLAQNQSLITFEIV